MRSWLQMDIDTGARIEAVLPNVFAEAGYAESLNEQRMKTCKTPACFRMWSFPKEYEGGASNVKTGRLTPGHRRQLLPVTLTLGIIFDSKRGIGGEETGYGELGSLTLVPRVTQAVMSWWENLHFHQPFEFVRAEMEREGTRSFWEVDLATLLNEPFVNE